MTPPPALPDTGLIVVPGTADNAAAKLASLGAIAEAAMSQGRPVRNHLEVGPNAIGAEQAGPQPSDLAEFVKESGGAVVFMPVRSEQDAEQAAAMSGLSLMVASMDGDAVTARAALVGLLGSSPALATVLHATTIWRLDFGGDDAQAVDYARELFAMWKKRRGAASEDAPLNWEGLSEFERANWLRKARFIENAGLRPKEAAPAGAAGGSADVGKWPKQMFRNFTVGCVEMGIAISSAILLGALIAGGSGACRIVSAAVAVVLFGTAAIGRLVHAGGACREPPTQEIEPTQAETAGLAAFLLAIWLP